MTARPMTEGEAEALFDKAVDALCAIYGSPMAASILDGRARLITKKLGYDSDTQEAIKIARDIAKLDDFHSLRSDAEKDAAKLARALLSTSAAERGMREALALVDKGFRTRKLKDASIIVGNDVKALSEIVSAALSGIDVEDEQATRGEDAATAPISTDTKGTSK